MADNIATDEFPYQIVALFEPHSAVGDRVYKGPRGWLPQVTLKRRFGLRAMTEQAFLTEAHAFIEAASSFKIEFGEIDAARHKLPVEVVEVVNQAPWDFYHAFIQHFGRHINSRFPEREGEHYYPHMTIEWHGKRVVDPNLFRNSSRTVWHTWLLKDDIAADDARIYAKFPLRGGKAR
ncbi:MAG TPA: hypothetical protein VLF60_04125 [Candidatus Saccharimonadales bacterium]|nr:hypothetical protein [Candidatus Saccharimonadales bacterium]